jgi:ubiquitin-conjugating enzyme E2 S
VNTLKKDWKSELGLRHVLLTIKCLLIVPNPESALNEEAGKLLLEHYDDYCARAKLYTDIHAKQCESSASSTKTLLNSNVASSNIQHNSGLSNSDNSDHSANKKTCNGVNGHENNTVKKAISKKDKIIKEKKKTLKRL